MTNHLQQWRLTYKRKPTLVKNEKTCGSTFFIFDQCPKGIKTAKQTLNDSLEIGVKLAILFASFMNIYKLAILFASFMNIYKLAWVCKARINAFRQDVKHQHLLLDVAAATLCYAL
jgi:hypothetical protein